MRELPPDLRAALFSSPDDLETCLVCGDWLQGAGDPQGELIALQARRLADPGDRALRLAESELLRSRQRELLGEATQLLDGLVLEWRLGFIRSIRLHRSRALGRKRSVAEVVETLWQLPTALLVDTLVLGELPWKKRGAHSPQHTLDRLSALRHPARLRSLFLFDDPGEVPRCELGALAEAIPGLEELTLHQGRIRLGRIRAHRLRSLWLHHDAPAQLAAALEGELPALEELGLWIEEDAPLAEPLETVLAGHFPGLRSLRLRHLENGDRWCAEIARSSIAPALELLELSLTRLSAESLRLLAERCPRLRLLDLAGTDLDPSALSSLPAGVVRWEAPPGEWRRAPYVAYGPSNPSYLRLRGEELMRPERAAGARALLGRCAGAGRALYDSGTLAMIAGDHAAAIPQLEAALELGDSGFHRSAFSNAAIAHERSGELVLADEIARRGLLAFPEEPNLWAIVIDSLRRQGRMREALEMVALAEPRIDGSPNGMALLEDVIMTLLQDGQPEVALERYQAFLAQGHSPRPKLEGYLALVHAHLRQLKPARAILRRLAGRSDEPVLDHAWACVHILEGKRSEATRRVKLARDKGYGEMSFVERDPLLLEGAGLGV